MIGIGKLSRGSDYRVFPVYIGLLFETSKLIISISSFLNLVTNAKQYGIMPH